MVYREGRDRGGNHRKFRHLTLLVERTNLRLMADSLNTLLQETDCMSSAFMMKDAEIQMTSHIRFVKPRSSYLQCVSLENPSSFWSVLYIYMPPKYKKFAPLHIFFSRFCTRPKTLCSFQQTVNNLDDFLTLYASETWFFKEP